MDIENLDVKVCDIGSGFEAKDINATRTITGTLPFLAPELIDSFSNMKTKTNPFKSDVFSLGLCLIYAICGKKFNSRIRKELSESSYKEILKDWLRMS